MEIEIPAERVSISNKDKEKLLQAVLVREKAPKRQ